MQNSVFDVIYSFATDYVKVWLVLGGILCFPQKKNKLQVYAVLTVQTILIAAAALLFNQRYSEEVMFFRIFLVILAVGLVFEGNFFKKLADAVLAYLLVLFLDGCVLGVASLYANMSGREVLQNNLFNIFIDIFNVFTIGIIVIIKNKKRYKASIYLSKRIYALIFAGVATGIIILGGLLIRSNDAASETARKLLVIVTIVVVIAYNSVCLMIIIVSESRDNYKALSLINQNVIESQQQYYSLVNEKQQEMRSIRHEMKNHLACIHALYQSGKAEEMEQYIKQLIEVSDLKSELFDTGNDIVNAILNDAQSKYAGNNIEFHLEGGFPNPLYILPMDLCVIFANLVSNAVEAVLNMEREQEEISCIDIRITSFKDDLFIKVTNPVSRNVEIPDGGLSTLKADKSLHGFGVKNVTQRVNKYQGTIDFKSENNRFFVEIHMINRS